MPLDKESLIDFLKVLDGELDACITLGAAGSTAMTLLDLKKSNRDVYFKNLISRNKAWTRYVLPQ